MFTISHKAKNLKQSGIRAASTRCAAMGGINLGQGICDIPVPDLIKQEAYQTIAQNKNVYSPCEGVLSLREALATKLKQFNNITADPATEIVITHGSTGAFVCATMTVFNPNDEVILFEPFYGYHKGILELNGIKVKTVPIHLEDFSINFDALKKAIGPHTKGIVICTPCNPCGKVFTKKELLALGEIARQHNLVIITDEIYEYIIYPGYEHVSIASLEDFNNRTITISGFSKTYNMTGWRLGYATGPAEVIAKMALVQDLFYVCPPTPLQAAVLAAFRLEQSYYMELNKHHLINRDLVVSVLRKLGFKFTLPQGAYYILADISALGFVDDEEIAKTILEKSKVALVAGRSFYVDPNQGKNLLRICYASNKDKINLAMDQLQATFG